jgi:hypothetical protein
MAFTIRILVELATIPLLFLTSLFARFRKRKIDVGLGPMPMINNIYHKKAIQNCGYSAETFCDQTYYITDNFDVRFDQLLLVKLRRVWIILKPFFIYLWCVNRYKCVLFYFNGGPLGQFTLFLWKFEPFFFRLANVKTLLLPFGGDVHEMSRTNNLLFKHAMCCDYPSNRKERIKTQKKIDSWIVNANHIVSGCEWVDYMYHWDTLTLGHFSIDLDNFESDIVTDSRTFFTKERPMRLLHAPNHKTIKGSKYFIDIVEELRSEGFPVELILVEKLSNTEILDLIKSADLVLDQLVIGWYAMFAIEAMASGKPVICNLRDDLEELYLATGLLSSRDEIPLIKATPFTLKQVLLNILGNPSILQDAGSRGPSYVKKHHSIESVSVIFSDILEKLIDAPI